MSNLAYKEPVYNDRVNETLKELAKGNSREQLSEKFELASWKSLDMYMRRKGFTFDSSKGNYVPATTKLDKVLDEVASAIPVKAEQIIRRFEKEGADPRTISQDMGFNNHREMADYMERNGMQWNPETGNYVEKIASQKASGKSTAKVKDEKVVSIHEVRQSSVNMETDEQGSLESFLPLLRILQKNRDRLLDLLMPSYEGHIPKYAVPGVPKTKSIYMSDLLARLVTEFSDSKNLSQREIVEASIIEYMKRYGFGQEVEKLLAKN